jgi:hypothetical protein
MAAALRHRWGKPHHESQEMSGSKIWESAAAKHWHDLYRQECLLRKDDAARYGAEIEALEAKVEQLENNEWRDAVLNQLIIACMDATVDEDPTSIIGRILDWHVAVATDPAVNGGFKLVPVGQLEQQLPASDMVWAMLLLATAEGGKVTVKKRLVEDLKESFAQAVITKTEEANGDYLLQVKGFRPSPGRINMDSRPIQEL